MSERIRLVKDDTDRVVTVDLADRATQTVLDVSGAAVVRMYLRVQNVDNVLDTVVATKLTGRTLPDGTLDSTVVTPGAGGRVQFALPPSFLARDPGYYEGEIEITAADGTISTVYDKLKFSIRADF